MGGLTQQMDILTEGCVLFPWPRIVTTLSVAMVKAILLENLAKILEKLGKPTSIKMFFQIDNELKY